MKLKVMKKKMITQEVAPVKEDLHSTLPPDTYEPLLPPRVIQVDDKNKIILQVRRGGEYGLPEVDIRIKTMTKRGDEVYTKKGFTLPVEALEEFSDTCVRLFDDIEEHNIIEVYNE